MKQPSSLRAWGPFQLGRFLLIVEVCAVALADMDNSHPSLLFTECYARYHADYYVHENGTKRTYYYGIVPCVIEVSKHRYIERVLCERFTHSMATAW